MTPWSRRRLPFDREQRAIFVKRRMITSAARIPKPEKMFEDLIAKGLARIERRRFKPPLLVWIPQEVA